MLMYEPKEISPDFKENYFLIYHMTSDLYLSCFDLYTENDSIVDNSVKVLNLTMSAPVYVHVSVDGCGKDWFLNETGSFICLLRNEDIIEIKCWVTKKNVKLWLRRKMDEYSAKKETREKDVLRIRA